MQYGYTGPISGSWRSQNAGDAATLAQAMATQVLIWETVVGERDEDFNHISPGSYDAVKSVVSTAHPLYSQFISCYNSMEASVQRHSAIPSFMSKNPNRAQSVELEWDGSSYTATLTDHNRVLSDYSFSANEDGISFSVSGNKLTITAATAPSDSVKITASKSGATRRGIITWTDGKFAPGSGIDADAHSIAEKQNEDSFYTVLAKHYMKRVAHHIHQTRQYLRQATLNGWCNEKSEPHNRQDAEYGENDGGLSVVISIVRDIYNSTIFSDIVKRNQVRKIDQLERVVKYTFNNVGNTFSAKSISDYLKAEHRALDNETVYSYLEKLEKAYLLHRCSRFDLQGKEILKTQEKFYLADTALRYSVLGYRAYSQSFEKCRRYNERRKYRRGRKRIHQYYCYTT